MAAGQEALRHRSSLQGAIRNRDGVPAPVLPRAPSECRRAPVEEAQAPALRGCAADPEPARRAHRRLAEARPRSEETQESLRRYPHGWFIGLAGSIALPRGTARVVLHWQRRADWWQVAHRWPLAESMTARELRTSTATTDNVAHVDVGVTGNCSLAPRPRGAMNRSPGVREAPSAAKGPERRLPARFRDQDAFFGAEQSDSIVLSGSPAWAHSGCPRPQTGRLQPSSCSAGLAQHPQRTAEAQAFLRRWRQSAVRWHRMLQGRSVGRRDVALTPESTSGSNLDFMYGGLGLGGASGHSGRQCTQHADQPSRPTSRLNQQP